MNEVAPPPLKFTDKLAGRLGPSPASTPPRTESPRPGKWIRCKFSLVNRHIFSNFQLSVLTISHQIIVITEGRISGASVFARLGNDESPGSSGSDSPINLSSLTAKLEAAKYESKYGSKVDRKKATQTQTKVTVTGLGKILVSSSSAEVND